MDDKIIDIIFRANKLGYELTTDEMFDDDRGWIRGFCLKHRNGDGWIYSKLSEIERFLDKCLL